MAAPYPSTAVAEAQALVVDIYYFANLTAGLMMLWNTSQAVTGSDSGSGQMDKLGSLTKISMKHPSWGPRRLLLGDLSI